MKCIFVEIEKCEFEFFLFKNEVDDKMKTKLKKLSFPNLWVHYPSKIEDKFTDLGDGVLQQGDFQCSSFSVIEPTKNAIYSIGYNEDRNSIILSLEGTFFSGNDSEVYEDDDQNSFMLSQTQGVIQVITLNNEKAKAIKKAKDEWGMSSRIEALASDLEYNNKGYSINCRFYTKPGIYQNGEIITD